jgi:predicted DNA-binding protein with PD1-like motif
MTPPPVHGRLEVIALRLRPGCDLRLSLERAFAGTGAGAGCVLSAVGSLERAALRPAGLDRETALETDLEIVALSGTLSPDGAHLHVAVSDAAGRVTGGHLLPGSRVRTTAEIVIGLLDGVRFARAPDPETGHAELVITPGTAQ